MANQSFPSKAIYAGGALLAAAMFMASASAVTQRGSPEIAATLFPMNAQAQVRIAEVDFAAGLNARTQNAADGDEQLSRAEAMARKSLAAQPLNPRALRILALADPESATTQALLNAGDAQSRRDTLTQIYLIEFAAQQGEIGAAMQHYDTVLRRRNAYRDAAGRNLATALAAPEVLDEVTEQLVASPSWESLLYFYAVQTPESFPSFLELHRRLADTDTIPLETSAQFAGALANEGLFDEAVEVAALTADRSGNAPLARADALNETAFATEPAFPGTWSVPESSSAYLQPISGGGAILTLPSGTTGLLAYRLTALTPGEYAAAIAIEVDEDGQDSRTSRTSPASRSAEAIEARLSCANRPPESLSAEPGDRTLTIADATIRGCRYQYLALYLTETQTRGGDVFLDAITVTPAR